MSEYIHLQSVGKVPAIKAEDIKAGDGLMWNFGIVYKVLSIDKETEKSIVISTQDVKGGEIYSQRLLKTRLVARVTI